MKYNKFNMSICLKNLLFSQNMSNFQINKNKL